tara:strand:- start:1362 stop:1961 length:600 start_codon:yes stop_codon:yes gene_type:complete
MKYYENILSNYLDIDLLSELRTIKDWSDFNRNNSHMLEYYGDRQIIIKVRQLLHSKSFISWVEKEMNVSGLVVDSQGVGEGVSLMKKGDSLDPHIDFNWNDRIKMNRAVNLCVYIGDCKGGEFHVWDEKRENILFEKEPIHNSAVLFKHSETHSHGVKPVTFGKRYTIRQFYYKSESICENPHQSLYWFNPEIKMPTNS